MGPAGPTDSGGDDDAGAALDPLRALEAAVRPAVRNPGGCFVSFSGGHDSSLVLTVATRVARAEGLALPVPVTWRFPDVPEADESSVQDALVAALGLPDWIKLNATDDLDLIGPLARRVLRRDGVRLPANAFLHEPIYELAAGGHLLLGSGGDEVFGRWRRPRRPWPLAPRTHELSWLRPPARRRARFALARHARSIPRDTTMRARWRVTRRDLALRYEAQRALAAHHGADVTFPLVDRRLVAALGRCGTDAIRTGGRAKFLHTLFAGELPAVAIAPRDKARFGDVFWRTAAREHAARWNGQGVDPALVDVDALRSIWTSDGPPPYRTMMLLQQTWLALDRATTTDEEQR